MFAVFVTVNVRAGMEDAFLAATKDNHLNSVLEPGCLRFDVLRDQQNPSRFYLYEVYANTAANAAHKATAHYARWAAAVEPMMDGPRSSIKMDALLPSPWA